MISKRNHFSNRSFQSKIVDLGESIAAQCIAPIMWMGVTCITLIVLQNSMNQRVSQSCPINISQVMIFKSILGDTHACVSRQMRYGAAAPLPD